LEPGRNGWINFKLAATLPRKVAPWFISGLTIISDIVFAALTSDTSWLLQLAQQPAE